MGKYNWFIPAMAVFTYLGFSASPVHAVRAIASNGAAVETIDQLDAMEWISGIKRHFRAAPVEALTGVPAGLNDHFIATFTPHHGYPELSQLKMKLRMAAAAGEVLPRYAPGVDPVSHVKADRDENVTQLGSLYISSSGLTLSLF